MDLGVVGTTPKTAACLHGLVSSLLFQGTATALWCGWKDGLAEFWPLQGIFYEQGFLPAYRLLLTLIHKIPELSPAAALIFPNEILYGRQKGFG